MTTPAQPQHPPQTESVPGRRIEDLAPGESPSHDAFVDTLQAVRGIPGYITDGDARFLFDRAMRVPDGGAILEIGSFMGLSAVIMAKALIRRGNTQARIYCVDTWKGSDEHQSLHGLGKPPFQVGIGSGRRMIAGNRARRSCWSQGG